MWLHGTTQIVLRRSRRFIMAPHGPSILTNTCAHTLSFNDRLMPHSHYETALLVCLVWAVVSAARDWCHARLNNKESPMAPSHCELQANWCKCHMPYRTDFTLVSHEFYALDFQPALCCYRVFSHQESPLVHLLWSGPNTMLIFFVWCGWLSHCPFCKRTRNCKLNHMCA